MKIVEIISRIAAMIFLAILLHATLKSERLGIAAGLAVCFLLVSKMPSIDSFKLRFGKDKSLEVKDEPKD